MVSLSHTFVERLSRTHFVDGETKITKEQLFCGFIFRLELSESTVRLKAKPNLQCEAFDLLLDYEISTRANRSGSSFFVDADLVSGGEGAHWSSPCLDVSKVFEEDEWCEVTIYLSLREMLTVRHSDFSVESERMNFTLLAGCERFHVDLEYLAKMGSAHFADLLERSKRGLHCYVVQSACQEDLRTFLDALYRYGKPVVTYKNWLTVLEVASLFNVDQVLKRCQAYLIDAKGIHLINKLEYALYFRMDNLVHALFRPLSHQQNALNVLNEYLEATGELIDQMHPALLPLFDIHGDLVLI